METREDINSEKAGLETREDINIERAGVKTAEEKKKSWYENARRLLVGILKK